ncbi:MAG: DUF2079 domain-containing protein [Patescibacteria group bacterium]|jgi:uncharacterized membrane protein
MNRYTKIILSASLGVALALIFFSIWKYSHQLYNALDLGIYTQTAWNIVHTHSWFNAIQNSVYLGDHVEFLLYPIAYISSIYLHPLTLTVIQILAIVSTSIPLYFIAKKFLSEKTSCILSVAFLLNPLIWNIALFEFHMLAFAIPMLMWLLFAYASKSYKLFFVFLLLSLLVREDVALVIFGIGALSLIDKRSVRWWLVPFISSIGWFIGALTINSHFAEHGYKFSLFYSWLGSSASDILLRLITDPWFVVSHVLNISNILLPIALLLLFLGFPLKGLRGLIPALPIFIQICFGLFNAKTILSTHYTALLIPFFLYATVIGIQKLQESPRVQRILRVVEFRRLLLLIGIVIICVNFAFLGPVAGLFKTTRDHNNALAASIPPSGSVIASYGPLTTVSAREWAYSLHYVALGHKQYSTSPYTLKVKPDYILLDLEDLTTLEFQYATNKNFEEDYATLPDRLRALLSTYSLVSSDGTQLLLRHTTDAQNSANDLLSKVTSHDANTTNTTTCAIEDILENTEAIAGPTIQIKAKVQLQDADLWRTLAFRISYTAPTGPESITVPVAWHLYALDDPSKMYDVTMLIPLKNFAQAGTAYQIELVTRKGRIQIASHRGSEDITDSISVLSTASATAH